MVLVATAGPAAAIEGFDRINQSRVVIVGGDSLAVGEYIDVYLENSDRVHTMLVEKIVPLGAEVEIDAFDYVHGEHRIFEMPGNIDTDLHAQSPQFGR